MAWEARLLDGAEAPPSLPGGWGGTFLQSPFWGAFKSGPSWEARSYACRSLDGGSEEFPLFLLLRRLPAGLSFAYVPHGPLFGRRGPASSYEDLLLTAEPGEAPSLEGDLGGLAAALAPTLPSACLFIRWDLPQFSEDPRFPPPFRGGGLRKARLDVQAPDSVVLDLCADEEGILAAMKSKWRYNIRLAEKKGVSLSIHRAGEGQALEQALSAFYRLYRLTSERDGIALHPESYYRRIFSLAASRPDGPDMRLFMAHEGGRDLAGIITLYSGEEAVYLYGASANEGRELMPAYALQWAAIREAKAAGCLRYDFFGIPPTEDSSHPMHGLYRFKTGFGGRIIHRRGAWDSPLGGGGRPFLYALYRAAEWLRWFRHKRLSKALAGLRRGRRGPQSASEKTSASNTKSSV